MDMTAVMVIIFISNSIINLKNFKNPKGSKTCELSLSHPRCPKKHLNDAQFGNAAYFTGKAPASRHP